MILSLNENRKPTITNKKFFNESLVMFDKEMNFFYKTKQLKARTPECKLQLVWDKMSRDKEAGEVVSVIISLVNNQYSCLVELLDVLIGMLARKACHCHCRFYCWILQLF